MRPCSVFSLLVISASNLVAQNSVARIGAFAGMNQSKIVGTASDISNHSGAAVGAFVAVPVSGAWSVQTGATWTQKGWEHSDPQDLNVVKLDYIQVPLLLRYDFSPRERLGAFAYFGPGLGFLGACSLSSTSHSTGTRVSVMCDEVERLSNGTTVFNSFDVGGIVGLGGRYAAGRVNLVATAQYDAGFKNLDNFGDNKSRTATFALGLELPIDRRRS